jgi:hypothetical protein
MVVAGNHSKTGRRVIHRNVRFPPAEATVCEDA